MSIPEPRRIMASTMKIVNSISEVEDLIGKHKAVFVVNYVEYKKETFGVKEEGKCPFHW